MKAIVLVLNRMKSMYIECPLPAKVSFWFIVCALIEKGISFLTVPVFVRLLTTEEYGLVTLYYSWLGVVSIFTTLNLQYGSLGTAQIKYENKKYSYVSSIQIIVTMISGMALLIIFCFSAFFEKVLDMSLSLLTVMIFESWAIFVIGLWKGNKRFDYQYKPIVIVTVVLAFLNPIIGITAVLTMTDKAVARLLSAFVIEFLIAVVLFYDTLKKGRCIYNKEYWRFALSFNIPIIPYYLAQIIFNVSDRIMISKLSGLDKAGIYGLVYTIAIILEFVRTSLNGGYGPWFNRKVKKKEGEQVQQLNQRILICAFFCISIFILLGPELVFLIGGKEYYAARWIVPPVSLCLLFSFLADNACYIEFYFEKKYFLVLATFLSAILNIVLNYLLIPSKGYMVAGYTTLLAYVVLWIFMSVGAKQTCEKNGIDKKLFLNLFFQLKIALCGLLMLPLMIILYGTTILRYCICGALLILCICFHKKIMKWVLQLRSSKED